MKFTLGWLKNHLETEASLDEITEALTSLGLEVEGVEDPAAMYGDFKVAYVEKAEKHPDADRLQVCSVKTENGTMQVVCGAPNARAGMKGIFAPEGSYIPGLDITLKKGVIRGVESCGMLVSEKEMCLSDEHKGIIEVDDTAEIGTPFATLYGLDDPVIEIGLTPNRPDCAGVRGIARDLAAAGLGTLKPLEETPVKGTFPSPISVKFDFEKDNTDACPVFIGRYIKGVKNGPSPEWLQNKLKAIGLRPISALVDITNYMSYDLCRPLHVFDADTLSGDLTVRLAAKGETIKALDEEEYTLDDFMTVIADDKKVHGIAGVMGGLDSGCTEDTVNVYLEVAYFDPARTAKTGRALQITSDARYRFERGIDPAFTVPATEIATRMILDICGGEASDNVVAGHVPDTIRTIEFDPAFTKKLSGIDLPAARQKEILEVLGFEVHGSGPFKVVPPSWRGDIDGKPDLVEEIIRVHGYEHLEQKSMVKDTPVTHAAETDMMQQKRLARQALASRGMQESVTWSFLPKEIANLFGADNNAALTLINPISTDLSQMRPSLLPNLIAAAGANRAKGFPDSAIFEVGPAFRTSKSDGYDVIAAGIRSGSNASKHWADENASRAVDVYDVKADAMAALAACGAPSDNAQVGLDAPEWYHPGRSASLRLGKNVLAYFGEIHPAVLQEMSIKGVVCGFEIFLDNIPTKRKQGTAKKLLAISPFQPVSKDFAFIIEDDAKADDIVRAAKSADKKLISNVTVFDIYRGQGVDDGKKSVAITVTLQPSDKTLSEKEMEDTMNKIIDTVQQKTGSTLRG